jgi:uncharacterized protein YbjQ (UPF0145 family)
MTHWLLEDRPVDEAASLRSVEAGGLPLRAQRRLAEAHTQGHTVWTSTLAPGETVVASQTGLEPISQVMGSCVYHVGYQGMYLAWAGGELTTLTAAYAHARSRALARMQAEAAALRAHLVVDVRFEGRGYDWAADLIEYTAIGTAVRLRGQAPPALPALTLLKTDELSKLHHAGYWPVAIAMGNCFWYDPHCDCSRDGSWYSQELPKHTRAGVVTRDLAVTRFREAAHRFNAHGVVGVQVERRAHDYEHDGHTTFHLELGLMGTAVVRHGQPGTPPRPKLVVDLADLPRRHGGHTL